MMPNRPNANRKPGFTLIEVLLAVSIFAIVLGAINSVFFAALRLRNKTTESIEKALPLQQALAVIQKDLEGMILPGGTFAGSFSTTIGSTNATPSFIGERVSPDIFTSSGPVTELARWADAQKVAYFLALPTNNLSTANGRDLVRLVTRNLLPVNIEEVESQSLLTGVQTARMQYYNGLTWADSWDSSTSTNLPAAIKVQITLADDYTNSTKTPAPIELVVPVLVQASTNSTSETSGGAQ